MAFSRNHPLYQEDLNYILSTEGIDELKGKSILITGATGLIGVCMIDALMKYNHDQKARIVIYAVGRDKEKARSRLGGYYNDAFFHFIEQDVRKPLPSGIKIDYIIPMASNTHPLAYSEYPIETIEINVKGAEHALIKAVETGATVLYTSTVEVYGNAIGDEIFTEDYTGRLNLSTARACYTESKRVCEAMCQSYIVQKGCSVKIARLSRIFGPTMLESDSKASAQFIKRALNGEDIILKSEGNQYFSYTYVAEAVSAMLHILLHGENGTAYNISNKACDVYLKQFAELCAQKVGKKVVFDLPSDVEKKGFSNASRGILDNTRLEAIGWKGKINISDAIFRTIEILKQ